MNQTLESRHINWPIILWVKFKLRKYTPYGKDLIQKRTELFIVDEIGKEKDLIYGLHK
jgi:hypothetical protein